MAPGTGDYRYTWIRDTAFGIYALVILGYTEEAKNFEQWLRMEHSRAGQRPSDYVWSGRGKTFDGSRAPTTYGLPVEHGQSASATGLIHSSS